MTTWTYSLRVFQRRRFRTLLTVGGIAVGVAILVANSVAIEAARRAYREMYECVAGKDCLEVVAPGQGGFAADVACGLASSPLVRAIVPRIVATAAVVDSSGASPALVSAVGGERNAEDRDEVLCEGQPLSEGDGILLDAAFASAHGFGPGMRVRLWTPSGPAELPLVGTIRPRGAAACTGAVAVRMTLPTAQKLFALSEKVNSVQLLLAEGVDPRQAETALAPSVPAGLAIQAPGQRGELARTTLRAAEQGLHALGLLAVVAGGFVVLNTSLMGLGERRRELAILRALGVPRRQVLGMLLRESALLGVVGGVLGWFAGLALAGLLACAMRNFLGVTVPAPQGGMRAAVLALLVGPGAALVPVIFANRRASRMPPLHDLIAVSERPNVAHGGRSWKFAGLVLLVGAVLAIAACSARLPAEWSSALFAPGLALLLAGGILLLPGLLVPLLNGLTAPLRQALGVEGRLARLQLIRRPVRTGLTAGVLFLAIAVAIGFGHAILHTLDDVRRWYRQAIVADFLVRGAMPDASFLLASSLPDTLGEELRSLRTVAGVEKISFLPARVNDRPVLLLARTFSPNRPLPIDLRDGDASAVREGLLRGEVVLGTVLAKNLGAAVGDAISLATPEGPIRLRVVGTAMEYAGGGEALYLEWGTARKLLHADGAHVFLVTAQAGKAAPLADSLRSFCGQHGLLLQSNRELCRLIDASLTRIIGALWVLLAVLFAVASLGIANTLTLNVLEQTREVGVLRAVGMSRGQVRKLILCQAFLLALAGLMPGTVAGLGLAALLEHAPTALPGRAGGFGVEPLLVLGCFGLASLIVVLAGLIPARRAARLPIVHSLRS